MIKHLKGLEINTIYDFDNAFSINELLCKLWEKIEEVINISNESIDILNWVKEQALSKEVEELITKLVDDGTIEQMINVDKIEELKNNVNNQLTNMTTTHNNDITTLNTKVDNLENTLTTNIDTFKEEIQQQVDDMEIAFENVLNTEITDLENNFESLSNSIDTKLSNIKYVENQTDLKSALEDGAIIYITKSIALTEIMYLPSNCRIIGKGDVTLTTNQNAIFVTGKLNVIGYNGTKNVIIDGITFDGLNEDTNGLTLVGIGHAQNITITNCTFKNLHIWHMLEINASKNVIVYNCKFDNYGNGSVNPTEAIQLDSMVNSGCFPWGGLYDNTSNDNVTIENCVFENIVTKAIGNHTFNNGAIQSNIKIHNNRFNNVTNCIYINDIKNVTITNNHAVNVDNFFRTETVYNSSENINISNNQYNGNRYDGNTVDTRFTMIQHEGNKDSYVIDSVNIDNNMIKNTNGHAIGYTGNNFKITNNTIKFTGRNGIYAYGGIIGLISNNIVTDFETGYTGIKVGGNAANITNNVLVNGNMSDMVISSNCNKVVVINNIGVIDNSSGLGELNNNY